MIMFKSENVFFIVGVQAIALCKTDEKNNKVSSLEENEKRKECFQKNIICGKRQTIEREDNKRC